MNIIVVGMGEVGKHIARVLQEEDHNIVLIDNSPDSLSEADESYDAMTLMGHAVCPRTLRQAKVEAADLFIAVTDNDEVNLLSALRAKSQGARKTIARVSNPIYFEDELGLHRNTFGQVDLVVNPQILVATEMHKLVRSVGAVAIEDFADNRIEMVQLHFDRASAHTDTPLHEIKLPSNTLIAAIDRKGKLVVPSGRDRIYPGDEVLFVGRIEQIPKLERYFKRERKRFINKVIIVGGSDIGEHLARALERDGISVVMIEEDRQRCYELVESLGPNVLVLNADGTDLHFLEEERVHRADAFIACSKHDEVNLMASLLAKNLGASRAIALVHKPDYASVCERLGVDVSLSPRLTVARQVLRYVRHGRLEVVRPVLDGRGEFLEFIAVSGSKITEKPIKKTDFPPGANICAVLSRKKAYVPTGNDVIHDGDHVVVFTTPELRAKVESFFQKPRGLFS